VPAHGAPQHFNPRSALFRPRQRAGIIITDIALLANAFALYYAFRPFGIGAFVRLYLVPYFVRAPGSLPRSPAPVNPARRSRTTGSCCSRT
jgi:hypothetical protein